MVQETEVQSQDKSDQKLKNFLLALHNIMSYGSTVSGAI